jgi:hypothetical protein
MKNLFARFIGDTAATTAIEYGLIGALISVVCIAGDDFDRRRASGRVQFRYCGHHPCSNPITPAKLRSRIEPFDWQLANISKRPRNLTPQIRLRRMATSAGPKNGLWPFAAASTIARFCPKWDKGRTTHVSEDAQISHIAPHVAPGRRNLKRLSRSATPRTNARASENRFPHRSDRTSRRWRPTTGGRRRTLPQ